MDYLNFPLGRVGRGSVVEVTLRGSESDVFLVDSANLGRFQRGEQFQYVGGHYTQSPVRLGVPSLGDWTAVVIPSGQVSASARLIAA